jgi:glycosyltransferase involved in cell wall biosynthesis
MPNDTGYCVKLSVIVPCYNAAETISVQLEALANQQWSEPWEIIIANNGSTDDSMAIVERYRQRLPNLRIIDASARRGAAYASNVGAEAAKGEAIAFCDADDEAAPGWVAAIGAALSKYDFVASRFETEKLNAPMFSRKHIQEERLMIASYPPYLPHAGGCGLGVKRLLHQKIGGFDESLLYLYETDFCFRLQLAQVRLYFVPEAVVHIRYRNSWLGMYRQSRGYSEYKLPLIKKHLALGAAKLSWMQLLRSWLYAWKELTKYLFQIRRKSDVTKFVWQLGWCVGRVKGCIKHRVLA